MLTLTRLFEVVVQRVTMTETYFRNDAIALARVMYTHNRYKASRLGHSDCGPSFTSTRAARLAALRGVHRISQCTTTLIAL